MLSFYRTFVFPNSSSFQNLASVSPFQLGMNPQVCLCGSRASDQAPPTLRQDLARSRCWLWLEWLVRATSPGPALPPPLKGTHRLRCAGAEHKEESLERPGELGRRRKGTGGQGPPLQVCAAAASGAPAPQRTAAAGLQPTRRNGTVGPGPRPELEARLEAGKELLSRAVALGPHCLRELSGIRGEGQDCSSTGIRQEFWRQLRRRLQSLPLSS